MKRRKFLSTIGPLAATPLMLNGLPVSAMSSFKSLQHMALTGDNDRVIVLIQLHGGNDGLNTVIPLDQYNVYQSMRSDIAIPDSGTRSYIDLDSTLPTNLQAGLHPDMSAMKDLYDDGKVNIVQGVTYDNTNLSHFRSRDIWFNGGGYDDYYNSGWMGRYLEYIFPTFPDGHPNADMPDPLGLEIGSTVSLGFARDGGLPAAIAVEDPVAFHNLINGVGGTLPPLIQGTHFGDEVAFIQGIEQASNDYASRLKDVYETGTNTASVTYPDTYPFNAPINYTDNVLAWQLQLIARLLAGGIKTKIFLARLPRFDTHNDQVQSNDPTTGAHAALLYHLSTAVKAFQEDLKGLGLEDRVLTMTFSEFGRRPSSNGSFGTDHGTAAPMFVIGKGVNPGITGTNPDLSNLDNSNNLLMQYDYRHVFIDVLQNWLGADQPTIDYTFYGEAEDPAIDLINSSYVTDLEGTSFSDGPSLYPNMPNPVSDKTLMRYYLNKPGHVKLSLFNMEGKQVKVWVDQEMGSGTHELEVEVKDLSAGAYLFRLETNGYYAARKMVVK